VETIEVKGKVICAPFESIVVLNCIEDMADEPKLLFETA
jgi:hypothetical protein